MQKGIHGLQDNKFRCTIYADAISVRQFEIDMWYTSTDELIL